MKRAGTAGATRVSAVAGVRYETRTTGGEKPQTAGRPGKSLMGRTSARPAMALGSAWPLDTLADIKHVRG